MPSQRPVSFKQQSFSGGILSPQEYSRSDQKKYAAGAADLQNAIVPRFGSAQLRPGSAYLDTVVQVPNAGPWDATYQYGHGSQVTYLGDTWVAFGTPTLGVAPGGSSWVIDPSGFTGEPICRLIKFAKDTSASYELLLTWNNIRVYKDGVQARIDISAAAVWDIATAYVIGNVVSRTGSVYICQNANTGIDPAVAATSFKGWNKLIQVGVSTQWLIDIPVNAVVSNTEFFALHSFALPTLQAVNLNDLMTLTSQYFRPMQLTHFSDTAWTLTHLNTGSLIGPPGGLSAVPGGVGVIHFVYVITAFSAVDGSQSVASAQVTCTAAVPTDAAPIVISWAAVAGASSYQVFRLINGIPGSIGITTLLTLNDINSQPDFASQPPNPIIDVGAAGLFLSEGNWPAVCAYFQQRLCFANTVNQPTSVWMSNIGRFANFNVSTPVLDSDAILFVVAGKTSQPITGLVDLQKLIIHTGASEYAATGNQFGTITPNAINCVLQGNCGATFPAPLVIGEADMYVQARANMVRDLRFRISSYTYGGQDLTIFSSQLFQGVTISQWDWQQIRDSIIWAAMSNGQLYGQTYVPEQEITAWHRHPFTNGAVEDVCVVSSATQDVAYLIVRRVINGQTVRYMEALQASSFSDYVYYSDFWGVDCGLNYKGTVTDGRSLQLSTAGGWTPTDLLTLTATGAKFAASDVTNGSQVVLTQYDANGVAIDRVTVSIVTFTSTTVVHGYAQRNVPTWAQASIPGIAQGLTQWGIAKTHFSGLSHLIGQSVSVLGDGNVLASPLHLDQQGQPLYPAIIVDGSGAVILPKAVLQCVIGLPIDMQIIGLPLENVQGETIANKHIQVKELCPIFYFSRGGSFGSDINHLDDWDQGQVQPPSNPIAGQPVSPWTGPVRIPIRGASDRTGKFVIRHVDPVPFALSGIIVTCEVADG